MLRLWPERLYAGLSWQAPWLARGNTGEPLQVAALPTGAPSPELLDALLHGAPKLRGAGKLSLMIPSQFARCVSLPWTPDLRGPEEMQAYALAHLEQAGLAAGDGYAVHAEFRHYGARGFAYAVPEVLLNELHAVAVRHELNLTTVLPLSGIAHLAAPRARGTGLEIFLVAEDASISALAMDRIGLRYYDAEPPIGGHGAALRRLLTRLAADGSEFQGISLCADADHKVLVDIAGGFAAQVSVHRMKSSHWRNFL